MRTLIKNNKIIGITILVAMISVACNSDTDHIEAAKWTNFISKEGGFKIEFPSKPDESTKVAKKKYGDLILHYFSYNAADKDGRDSNLVYYVSYADFPVSLIDSNNSEFLTQLFKDEAEDKANLLHGKLVHVTAESINNYPVQASEITFEFKDIQMVCRQRFLIVKNRLYTILVDTETKKGFNKSVDHFFNSFELQ